MDTNTKTSQTDNEAPDTKLLTGAKLGEWPIPETIRQGTVYMEAHPDIEAQIQQAKDAGFEIKFTAGDPCVKVVEVYDVLGNLIRVEKELYLQKGMRYLDLEHEIGHIDQLSRFGDQVPPTDKVVELPNGRRKSAPNQKGVLTTWQAKIVEYHNRLTEFLRLYERGIDVHFLREHAKGVDEWKQKYWQEGVKKERSPTRTNWANKYFGEIKELAKEYDEAMQIINSGHYPRN